ncbi:hypothetical protein B0J15DRAFT_457444 [Fusarium solani]|uniref:Secreted protein n=1 Tax=Fusarium solani TaxID=169388 RepID=A0A9P9L6V1_FUSSL|nr:uncharacterized protein B0J15DRAFT_457444 [Fusarium solani]KAH7275266.1 hypothetical protein B0J15DRAFT_457444 [Fusarium solani]
MGIGGALLVLLPVPVVLLLEVVRKWTVFLEAGLEDEDTVVANVEVDLGVGEEVEEAGDETGVVVVGEPRRGKRRRQQAYSGPSCKLKGAAAPGCWRVVGGVGGSEMREGGNTDWVWDCDWDWVEGGPWVDAEAWDWDWDGRR